MERDRRIKGVILRGTGGDMACNTSASEISSNGPCGSREAGHECGTDSWQQLFPADPGEFLRQAGASLKSGASTRRTRPCWWQRADSFGREAAPRKRR